MPTFDIIKKHTTKKTFRTESVIGKFDLQTDLIQEHFAGNINLPNKWNIGLIVGNSGTGKTTIAKELFPNYYVQILKFGNNSIIDEMPKNANVDEITKMFNAVGFSSPPSWLKPYNVLSNGEKMRVDLAYSLLSNKKLFVHLQKATLKQLYDKFWRQNKYQWFRQTPGAHKPHWG